MIRALSLAVALAALLAAPSGPLADEGAPPPTDKGAPQPAEVPLAPEPGWPRWLEDGNFRTDQTSGLAFVGRDAEGARVFLAADDTGDLWRLVVGRGDGAFRLAPILVVGAAHDTLARFPKKDIEAIALSTESGRLLLSIEGNAPKGPGADAAPDSAFREWLGIFDATVEPDVLHAERVVRLERLALPEWREATRFATKNCGFEGMALRGDTLLLGLEGIMPSDKVFADSTYFESYDLSTGTRCERGTKPHGIVTVTGLDTGPDGRVYGVDRNSLRIFSFRWTRDGISEFRSAPLSMPGVKGLPYRIPSPESIAVDDEGFLWVAVDPWIYEPISTEGLSARDVRNYKRLVPLLYKYRVPPSP